MILGLGGALQAAPASATAPGWVRGEVVEAGSGRPVAGATITLPAFGVRARSTGNGAFDFGRVLPTPSPYRRITAIVTAPTFGTWTIKAVPLYPNDTLILHAELRSTAVTHRVTLPEERRSRGQVANARTLGNTGKTCTGWDYQLVPPPNIRVHRSSGGVDKVNFSFYVSHVLPQEWIPSWKPNALAAGAIAVKTYAAYRAMSGHARTSGSGCYDVFDTVSDQIYDPTHTYDSTELAVAASFGSVFYRNGGLFLAQYFAGAEGDPCEPVTGSFAGRMSQWGTQTCAKNEKLWPSIVMTFYTGYTTWNYLRNVLLNPSASAPPMFPWVGAGPSEVKRTEGAGSDGGWYLTVSPTRSGQTATMFQSRPYPGSTSTEYTVTTHLRCASSSGSACSVEIKLIGTPATGKEQIRRFSVTVPKDGQWHGYTFHPSRFTVAQKEVRFSVVTSKTIGVDASSVSTLYAM